MSDRRSEDRDAASPCIPVGFQYAAAVLELRKVYTYEVIAGHCGFTDKKAVQRITVGDIPRHPQGEAIWVLYVGTFGRRPPMALAQTAGLPEFVAPAKRQGPPSGT